MSNYISDRRTIKHTNYGQNDLRAFDRLYFESYTEGSDAEQKISVLEGYFVFIPCLIAKTSLKCENACELAVCLVRLSG